jgi:hypothetical protein
MITEFFILTLCGETTSTRRRPRELLIIREYKSLGVSSVEQVVTRKSRHAARMYAYIRRAARLGRAGLKAARDGKVVIWEHKTDRLGAHFSASLDRSHLFSDIYSLVTMLCKLQKSFNSFGIEIRFQSLLSLPSSPLSASLLLPQSPFKRSALTATTNVSAVEKGCDGRT